MSQPAVPNGESLGLTQSPLRRKHVLNLSNSDTSLGQVRCKINVW